MADPQPTEVVQGTTAGGVGGQTLGQGLVEAIAGAVQTGVAQAMSTANAQMQAQFQALKTDIDATNASLKSLSETVTKVVGATDSDSGYLVRSSVDPSDDQRRAGSHRNRIELLAEMALEDCIEIRKVWSSLMVDHRAEGHSYTRTNAGPGTMDTKPNA